MNLFHRMNLDDGLELRYQARRGKRGGWYNSHVLLASADDIQGEIAILREVHSEIRDLRVVRVTTVWSEKDE